MQFSGVQHSSGVPWVTSASNCLDSLSLDSKVRAVIHYVTQLEPLSLKVFRRFCDTSALFCEVRCDTSLFLVPPGDPALPVTHGCL